MIFTSQCGYQGRLVKVDISSKTKSERCQKIKCSNKNYKEVLERNKPVLEELAIVAKSKDVAIICSCEDLNCNRFKLANYLVNLHNCQYEGEIGQQDQNVLQNLDRLEIDDNIISFLYERSEEPEEVIRQKIADIWKSEDRTASDCLREFEETNDNYKQSLDIPTPQALVDMGCMDKGYLELHTELVRSSYDKCCKNKDGEKIANNCAGRMNQAHFSELCEVYNKRLYRLEERSGKELQKCRDIEWIAKNIGCTLVEADQFNKAWKDLELGQKEVNKIIFGYSDKTVKKPGIKNTGNKFLQQFLGLQNAVAEFKLVEKFEPYTEEGEAQNQIDEICEEWNLDIEVTEQGFIEEESFNTSLYSAKRLSIDEESLSEEEIAEIRYGSYEQYKEILSRYMKKSYKGTSDISNKKLPSAVSMGWIYLKEAGEKFRKEKQDRIDSELKKLPEYQKVAIAEYKSNPSRSNKYRITTCVYGGNWDGIEIPKATKEQKEVLWSVIYSK
jgi:hypothetical protein